MAKGQLQFPAVPSKQQGERIVIITITRSPSPCPKACQAGAAPPSPPVRLPHLAARSLVLGATLRTHPSEAQGLRSTAHRDRARATAARPSCSWAGELNARCSLGRSSRAGSRRQLARGPTPGGLPSTPCSSSFFHFSTCQFLLSSPPSPWTDAWGREGRGKVPSL